jgi:hypothetical protein
MAYDIVRQPRSPGKEDAMLFLVFLSLKAFLFPLGEVCDPLISVISATKSFKEARTTKTVAFCEIWQIGPG